MGDMILARQRSNGDCGPVALYNLARILGHESAKGGYRANFAHFAEMIDYRGRKGSRRSMFFPAARAEMAGKPYKLIKRRPFWANVVNQLDRASSPHTICVLGWCTNKEGHRESHVALAWRDFNRNGIWVANCAPDRAVVPIYLRQGPYWPTMRHPVGDNPKFCKLLDFWQVVPRKRRRR